MGEGREMAEHHLEIRGLGFIDIRRMLEFVVFGFKKGWKWKCIWWTGTTVFITIAPVWKK